MTVPKEYISRSRGISYTRSYSPNEADQSPQTVSPEEEIDQLIDEVLKAKLLTPKEAAKYLRCSVSYLAKSRMSGTGPPFSRVGRNVVYRMKDLFDYVDGNLRISTINRAHPETGELPEGGI